MRLNSVNSKKKKKKKKGKRVCESFMSWLKIFCIYKTYLISAEGYKNAGVDL